MTYNEDETTEEGGRIKGRGERPGSSSWIAYLLFCLFIFFGGIWFLFFSHFFTVTDFEILELSVLEKEAVAGEIGAYLDGKSGFIKDKRNIFIIDEEEVAKHLMNTFLPSK